MLETKSDLTHILSSGLGSCLDEAPPVLRDDRDMILLAVQNGYASSRLGKFFGQDHEFFFRLLGSSNQIASFYKKLPVILQQDPKVATAVVKNSSLCDEAMLLIAKHTESDFLNEDLVKTVVQKGLLKILGTRPLEALMGRKDFVMELIKIDGASILRASRELKADMECILAALKDSDKRASVRNLAPFIPEDKWNSANSLITIIRATEGAPRDDEEFLCRRISNDMFMKINVYLACIEAGWLSDYLPWQARNRHTYDESANLALLKAKLKRGVNPQKLSIWRLYNAQRTTIESFIPFFPGIVQRSNRCRHNFDLKLTAVTHSREALMSFDHSTIQRIKGIMSFAEEVREKKAELDTFLYNFFGAMLIQPPPPKKKSRKGKKGQAPSTICHLPMLGLGGGAGVTIKKKITEYAGIKFGSHYAKLKKADEYLALYGPRKTSSFTPPYHDNNNGSNADDDNLEREIQAAGQIYQSIKNLRMQKEKKRRLRQRMRSLEDDYTWMKQSHTVSSSSSTGDSETKRLEQTLTTSNLGASLPKTNTLDTTSSHSLTVGDAATVPLSSNNLKNDDSGKGEVNMNESFQSDATTLDPAELLEICEEQQDILEQLTERHQNDFESWNDKQSKLQSELEKSQQERDEWKKMAAKSADELRVAKAQASRLRETEEQVQVAVEDLVTKEQEMEQLQQQVETLNLQLANQEKSFEQRIQEEQAKTQVASQ
ncbi:MAG: hypothetical protein SGILL_010003, partial [Bacillariaceae sp.]